MGDREHSGFGSDGAETTRMQLGSGGSPAPPASPIVRLNRILLAALNSAATIAHSPATSGRGDDNPFAGLYVDAATARAHLHHVTQPRTPPVMAERPGPSWSDIVSANPRWSWLRKTYGLNDFELDVALLALAPEVDRHYGPVLAYLNDDVTQKLPTVGLALELLIDQPQRASIARGHFAPDAPLQRHRVISLTPSQHSPTMLAATYSLDPQITDMVLDGGGLDERLASSSRLWRPGDSPTFDGPHLSCPDALIDAIGEALDSRPEIIYLHGADDAGAHAAAEAVAGQYGVPLLISTVRRLGRTLRLDDELDVLFREAQLQHAVLVVDGWQDVGDLGPDAPALFDEHLFRYDGVALVCGTAPWSPPGRHALGVRVIEHRLPDVRRRRAIWANTLFAEGIATDDSVLDALASRFRFGQRQVVDAVRTAGQHRGGVAESTDSNPVAADLFAAARAQSRTELAASARKIEPSYGWDDIVLPDEVAAQLRELTLRVAHRDRVLRDWGYDRILSQGKGITALFAGPPGTGKTMAAEVIARELGVDLYKIDLSSVISKYIGETEKNLERIFVAAPQANACLLFDEADSLFGKRSAVRDSHDRYANQEVSYLLQRMEQYDGLAVLTTNRRDHLDDAFLRRLQFIVEFPLPTEVERRRIWSSRLPPEAPRAAQVDLAQLARTYPLSGGSISNITLAAAYLAAADAGMITMDHIVTATRAEYKKLGRVPPEAATSLAEKPA